ncbi:hypothetical protein U1Q18_043735, partial [Sarracenia purpurea var. burkii]
RGSPPANPFKLDGDLTTGSASSDGSAEATEAEHREDFDYGCGWKLGAVGTGRQVCRIPVNSGHFLRASDPVLRGFPWRRRVRPSRVRRMEAERENRLRPLPKLFSSLSIGFEKSGEILESTIVIVLLPRSFLSAPGMLFFALIPIDLRFDKA